LEVRRILLLFVMGALLTALTATVASAQAPETVRIEETGVVEEVNPNPIAEETQFVMNVEETGAERPLLECPPRGAVTNLEDFVGQRVTVTGSLQTFGAPVSGFENPDEIPVCVTSIELAGNGNAQGKDIYGTAYSDYLTDTAGNDNVYALGSGDTISAGKGRDTLYGGTGWDYVVGGYGNDTLYGWMGSDWLDGGADSDTVYGWTGNDLVDGGTGNDTVYGGVGNDAVYGYKGSDDLFGGSGHDYVYSAGDGTFDRVYGGPGYDVCVAGPEDFVSGGCEEIYGQ
jgi:Ca2+-binding RTX toxin-like protein